jgi:hypothetical protein
MSSNNISPDLLKQAIAYADAKTHGGDGNDAINNKAELDAFYDFIKKNDPNAVYHGKSKQSGFGENVWRIKADSITGGKNLEWGKFQGDLTKGDFKKQFNDGKGGFSFSFKQLKDKLGSEDTTPDKTETSKEGSEDSVQAASQASASSKASASSDADSSVFNFNITPTDLANGDLRQDGLRKIIETKLPALAVNFKNLEKGVYIQTPTATRLQALGQIFAGMGSGWEKVLLEEGKKTGLTKEKLYAIDDKGFLKLTLASIKLKSGEELQKDASGNYIIPDDIAVTKETIEKFNSTIAADKKQAANTSVTKSAVKVDGAPNQPSDPDLKPATVGIK